MGEVKLLWPVIVPVYTSTGKRIPNTVLYMSAKTFEHIDRTPKRVGEATPVRVLAFRKEETGSVGTGIVPDRILVLQKSYQTSLFGRRWCLVCMWASDEEYLVRNGPKLSLLGRTG